MGTTHGTYGVVSKRTEKTHFDPTVVTGCSRFISASTFAERSALVNTSFMMPTCDKHNATIETSCTVAVYYPLNNVYKLTYDTDVSFEYLKAPRFVTHDTLALMHPAHVDFGQKIVRRWTALHAPPVSESILFHGVDTPVVNIYACKYCGGDLPMHTGIAEMDNMPVCKDKRDADLASDLAQQSGGMIYTSHALHLLETEELEFFEDYVPGNNSY